MVKEDIITFYFPAPNVANQMSVKEFRPVSETANELEIVVLQGGPVFFFEGRVDGAQAYARTHNGECNFDFGANNSQAAKIGIGSRFGTFTLACDVETIGFVRAKRSKDAG